MTAKEVRPLLDALVTRLAGRPNSEAIASALGHLERRNAPAGDYERLLQRISGDQVVQSASPEPLSPLMLLGLP